MADTNASASTEEYWIGKSNWNENKWAGALPNKAAAHGNHTVANANIVEFRLY